MGRKSETNKSTVSPVLSPGRNEEKWWKQNQVSITHMVLPGLQWLRLRINLFMHGVFWGWHWRPNTFSMDPQPSGLCHRPAKVQLRVSRRLPARGSLARLLSRPRLWLFRPPVAGVACIQPARNWEGGQGTISHALQGGLDPKNIRRTNFCMTGSWASSCMVCFEVDAATLFRWTRSPPVFATGLPRCDRMSLAACLQGAPWQDS